MRRSWRAMLCGALAALPAAGAQALECGAGAPLAASVRLEYAATATRSVLSLSGNGTVVFRRQGDEYSMESMLQAFGIFEAHQTSSGSVRATGLVPREFSQRSSRRPQRRVSFDWSAQRVSFGDGDAPEPTRPQMQDRLSMVLQLAWRLRNEPHLRRVAFPVAGLRHTSDYVFNHQGSETLTVPAGRYETIKFERHKDDGDDSLEVWLAPELCSLPVRLRFTDDKGLTVEQQLRAVRAE